MNRDILPGVSRQQIAISTVIPTNFFAFLLVLLGVQNVWASTSTRLPTNIMVDTISKSSCFVWTDEFKLTEREVGQAGYPTQIAYFAKHAIVSDCKERHHFELIHLKAYRISVREGNTLSNSTKSCQSKANKEFVKNSSPRFVYAVRVRSKHNGAVSACLVAGNVSTGPKSKTFIFEELFNSFMKKAK
jgi:hypothetical protein